MLEYAFYWSQIILMFVALFAACGAYAQLHSSNRFELMRMLESPKARESRRMLFQKLRLSKAPEPWWENDPELEEAAATVCASYDIVGIMAKHRIRRFFTKQWSYNICWTYEALGKYLEVRRKADPLAYEGYRMLYEDAKSFDHRNHT